MKRILLLCFGMFCCFTLAFSQANQGLSKQQVIYQDQSNSTNPFSVDFFSERLLQDTQPQRIPSQDQSGNNGGISANSNTDNYLANAEYEKCATVETMEALRQKYPQWESIDNFETWMAEKLAEKELMQFSGGENLFDGEIIEIPYVIHIVHDGTPVNTPGNIVGSNLSAAQVNSQITVLNEDFRATNENAGEPIWQHLVADMEMQFVPAMYNPQTGLPLDEPGIDRVDRNEYGFTAPPYSTTYIDNTIKPATSWECSVAMNLWVMELPGGLYGYAQFPSSSDLEGMPENGGPLTSDGVVMAPFTFGTTELDDGSFTTESTEYGRTTTHEIGHWIGLRHIWGDGPCDADDFCEDTPRASSSHPFGQCTDLNNCDDTEYGADEDLPNMKENYMDYSADNCMNLFTLDQLARAEIVFENSPCRGTLIDSDLDEEGTPQVYISPDFAALSVVEAENCATFADYELEVQVAYDYTGTSDIVVDVLVGDETTAVEGEDFDFIGGNTVTFSGGERETGTVTVRVYNDAVTEGTETLEFELALDAGDTNVILTPNEDYSSTTWEIEDAVNSEELPVVSIREYESSADPLDCFESGSVTLNIVFDNWAGETSWDIQDSSGAVVASGDGYGGQDSITEVIDLADGGYVFTIYDSIGDGICCDYGDGSYTLTDSAGNVIVTGGEFGDEEVTTFCLGAAIVEQPVQIGIDPTVVEAVNCGEDYTDYFFEVMIDKCVFGQQDLTVNVVADDASTAVEGDDYDFPNGNTVTFNGEGEQILPFTVRIYAEGEVEDAEQLMLMLELNEEDEDVATISEEAGESDITINDSDSPFVEVSTTEGMIRESNYEGCDDLSNVFEFSLDLTGCVEFDEPLEVMVNVDETTSTADEDDYNILTPTVVVGGDEEAVVQIEVIDDLMNEETETLVLTFSSSETTGFSNSVVLSILDSYGTSAPEIVEIWNLDFESGLPEGWTILSSPESTVNTMVVSDATAMDGNALHVSNDGVSFEYDATPSGFEYLMAVSPPFVLDNTMQLDFDFQVWGEAGLFGNFDFGYYGMLPAGTDPNNPDEILTEALGAQLLLNSAEVSTLQDYLEVDAYYPASVFPEDVGEEQRMILAWASDYLFQYQPPAGYDNVRLFVEPGIEDEVALPNQQPNYPITAGTDTYFYNTGDGDIMMMVNSAADNGCSTGYVDGAGTSAVPYISTFTSDWRSSKSFVVETETASEDEPLTVGLYYTEEEIAGWEQATGNSREDLYMFKQEGALGTCFDTQVNLSITLDDWPGETTWELVDASTGQVVASGGPYAGQDFETITESFDLPAGTYSFTIFDSIGDGICCSYGDGSYTLSDSNGNVIAEGGAFGDSESTTFCTDESSGEVDSCRNYSEVEFAPVTLEPYANGFKLVSSFETGLYEETGFSVASVPAITPAEFTAEQNGEQIDITFENRFDESSIAYYIFEIQYLENDTSEELETVEADGSGTYTVTDYFPRLGLNVYSVTYVLTNGEKIEVCYTAEEFYESTEETKIYPNPATNEINILVSENNMKGEIMIGVYDEQGRLVRSQELTTTRGVIRHRMDITELATGTYYVRITSGEGDEIVKTFVKTSN